CSGAILASAKEGTGTKEILEAIVRLVPPPKGSAEAPLRALIFDSWFDNYQGVIVLVRVFDGTVRPGMKMRLMAAGKEYEIDKVGVFRPKMETVSLLSAGDVGYIIAGIKTVGDTKIGDTITDAARPAETPLSGYKEIKPMVFSGLYPFENIQYEELKNALEKLRLNDSSFSFEPETSSALGFGFRCGFLGLLHMEIIKERLEREFELSLITTAPTVIYKVTGSKGEEFFIDNPSSLPNSFEKIEEPYVKVSVFVPQEYIGQILELCQEKRGTQTEFTFISKDRIMVAYEIPLNEILWDFYDRLKSVSRGYASMDYEFIGYRPSKLVKLDVLLNGEPVDALSLIVHSDKSYYKGRQIVEKLRQVIPRQMFEIAIQAAIGGKIIARESVKAMRKNVLAKCYGGDITRKRKLLEKQKEGKKKMKQIGKVEIPQEAFLTVLKVKE